MSVSVCNKVFKVCACVALTLRCDRASWQRVALYVPRPRLAVSLLEKNAQRKPETKFSDHLCFSRVGRSVPALGGRRARDPAVHVLYFLTVAQAAIVTRGPRCLGGIITPAGTPQQFANLRLTHHAARSLGLSSLVLSRRENISTTV